MKKEELERLRKELIDSKYQLAKDRIELILRQMYFQYSEQLACDNPIEHIKYRVKAPNSIKNKLEMKGYLCTSENVDYYLHDIVGARIVCPFLSDVERVVKDIRENPELQVLVCKDYINNPKNNGYASYHLIVKVPVNVGNKISYVKSEIQIRTMAMDMWASLEHKIGYKNKTFLSDEDMAVIDNMAIECSKLDNRLNEKYLCNRSKDYFDDFEDYFAIDGIEYSKLYNKYSHALSYVLNKIHYLNQSYDFGEENMMGVNPIEHIKYRIKPYDMMIKKLRKKTNDISISSLEDNVHDIAGIRVVCSFLSDLNDIVNSLKNDLGLNVVEEKDYVTCPKESGYAGYHLIVSVPVYDNVGVSYANVEIQVRTIAMDMWASLEHKLCYNKEADEETKWDLLELACHRFDTDKKMEDIISEKRKKLSK